MTYRRGVCLVRFDDKIGPNCLYQNGLDDLFVQKVCIKSQISTLSLSSSESLKEEYIESIIPFLDEGFIAYSNFFYIKDQTARGGKRPWGIVTLVDKSEQMALYKNMPEISAIVKKIASELIKYQYNDINLSEQIKDKLNQLLKIENLVVNFDEDNDSVKLIKERIDTESFQEEMVESNSDVIISEGSFEFLFSRIPINLDRIIFALLKNERVLIFGEEKDISLILATLRWFLPHKKLYNDLWTVPLVDGEALFSRTSDSTNLHALGIHKESFQELFDSDNKFKDENLESLVKVNQELFKYDTETLETKVIVDIDNGSVIGGISNRFCQNLVDKIINNSYDKILEIISDYIDYLLGRVFDFIILILEEAEKELIEQFIENSIDGEVSLIVSIINETNPVVMQKLLEFFSKNEISLDVLF
ncbi:MAG: hypothetical protein JXA54_16210 [Candidatus Heimdallarchaeota archaeon]|nr:hypothetical protein [Candidatus Heimdallarchaeota archaeon]